MPGLLRFSKVPEGPASLLLCMARTPFALMQQCPWKSLIASPPRIWVKAMSIRTWPRS
jgi:hypothetical protein